MQYCISTNYFAAMTCDLTPEQFEQFFTQCRGGITQDVYGPRDSVSYRENWSATEDDERLERDIATENMGIQKTLVRIFPASILKTAPTWLSRNKKKFKEWLMLYKSGRLEEHDEFCDLPLQWDCKHLARYLDFAVEIRDNHKIASANSDDAEPSAEDDCATRIIQKKKKRGRPLNARSSWVIERHKEGLSDKSIFKMWNEMTHAERKEIDQGTYKIQSSDDHTETHDNCKPFKSLSNVSRIVIVTYLKFTLTR